mmetsp:Transcript_76861/g.207275  ORF Transcript_76861/g.207275 Transcript_76861/m.207275 type:complete len:200 (+) Transcript_76861:487-1086(+)
MCSSLVFVHRQQCLHVALAAHDDGAAVVDVLGDDILDAADLAQKHASGGHASCLLSDHSHGETLVQHAKLALGILLVRRVNEDATVQQGAVHIGDHGADISGSIASVLAGMHVVLDGLIPGVQVPLVAGVDLLAAVLRELDLLHEEELADGAVQGEAVDALPVGDDQLRGGAEHAVARRDALGAGAEDVLHSGILSRRA